MQKDGLTMQKSEWCEMRDHAIMHLKKALKYMRRVKEEEDFALVLITPNDRCLTGPAMDLFLMLRERTFHVEHEMFVSQKDNPYHALDDGDHDHNDDDDDSLH